MGMHLGVLCKLLNIVFFNVILITIGSSLAYGSLDAPMCDYSPFYL